jgi:hypothetical protein
LAQNEAVLMGYQTTLAASLGQGLRDEVILSLHGESFVPSNRI